MAANAKLLIIIIVVDLIVSFFRQIVIQRRALFQQALKSQGSFPVAQGGDRCLNAVLDRSGRMLAQPRRHWI